MVDDEAGIRKVLGISLQDSGYDVHTAENGQEALRLFKEIAPPIVLTDIKMPDIDGIELLRRIKQENPDTEVIMFTGHGDMELAIKSLKHDATDFVTKPINDEVLDIALKRARERMSMRRRLREYTENLERLVAEKAQKLIEAERLAAIGPTVSELSHAIKSIANGLKGGIFVLGKGIELDNKQYLHEGWEIVESNVEKIKNLSLDLLNYGRYADVAFTLADPNTPAIEVGRLLESKAKDEGIELKAELSDRLLQHLYDKLPQIEGKIDYHELSTPLSTEWFSAYQHGELYGLDHTPERMQQDWLTPRTRIPGLWLTGQDILTCGVTGAMMSGLLTATAMVGAKKMGPLMKRIYV